MVDKLEKRLNSDKIIDIAEEFYGKLSELDITVGEKFMIVTMIKTFTEDELMKLLHEDFFIKREEFDETEDDDDDENPIVG